MALPDTGASTTLIWAAGTDSNTDATRPGSLKVTVTFANWNQFINVVMQAPTDANGDPIDLTNKLITAMVKIKQGTSPGASYPYAAVLFVQTGVNYTWGGSKRFAIESTSDWVTLTLDTTNAQVVPSNQTWDPATPMTLGIDLTTGGGGETTYCALDYAVGFGPPQTTIFYVDDIEIRPRP